MKTIFVSSTFCDMHYERDILHEIVLPELNEYAAQYGENIAFCDLRWGINTGDLNSEEGSKKILSVCLDEIDRCRPYMLVVLGERYGWIPNVEVIQTALKSKEGFSIKDLEKSITALEIEYGALAKREQLKYTLFYFREFEGNMPDIYKKEDDYHAQKLYELKECIRKFAGNRLRTYTVRWDDEKGYLAGMDGFADIVLCDLKEMIKESKILTSFEKEQYFQWNYAFQKAEQFSARENLVEKYIKDLNHGRYLVTMAGETGCGKSTLMSRLVVRLKEEGKEVLPIFCGNSLLCSDAIGIMKYIVYFIESKLSFNKLSDYESIWEKSEGTSKGYSMGVDEWVGRLVKVIATWNVKSRKELIIVIDGVDQLYADEARNRLCFIPPNLSTKVKMVVSGLNEFFEKSYSDLENIETLGTLDEKDKRIVVSGILNSIGKELGDCVVDRIVEKKRSDNPLYLSLIIQRLVMMNKKDFDEIAVYGGGIAGIMRYQMKIVEQASDELSYLCKDILDVASERIGGQMVEQAVWYLATSKYGLWEKDLEKIFSMQGIEWNRIDFSLFIKYMKKFFYLRTDGRWDFTHKSIREGFLAERCKNIKELHRRILDYLKQTEQWDVRVDEIVYHCYGADEKEFFVKYIIKYIMSALKRDKRQLLLRIFYNIFMEDRGKWICEILDEGKKYFGDLDELWMFTIICLYNGNRDVKQELKVKKKIFISALNLVKRFKGDPKNLYYRVYFLKEVGDIYKKLDQRNSIIKAKEYYEKSIECLNRLIKIKGVTEKECDILHSIGETYGTFDGLENLDKTKKIYSQSIKLYEKLSREQRTVSNWEKLDSVYKSIGKFYADQGGLENQKVAEKLYMNSIQLRERLYEREKTDTNLRDTGFAYELLGRLYIDMEAWINVEKTFIRSAQIFEKIVERKETPESLNDLGFSYKMLTLAYIKLDGQINYSYTEKIRNRGDDLLKKSNELKYKLLKKDSEIDNRILEKNWFLVMTRAVEHEQLGDYFRKLKDNDSLLLAKESYGRALKIMEKLVNEEMNVDYLWILSLMYKKVINFYRELGDEINLIIAQKLNEKDLIVRRNIVKAEGTAKSRQHLSEGYFSKRMICQALGGTENIEIAKKSYEKGRKLIEELVEEKVDIERLRNLSLQQKYLGKFYEKLGGTQSWKIAMDLYKQNLRLKEENGKGSEYNRKSQ